MHIYKISAATVSLNLLRTANNTLALTFDYDSLNNNFKCCTKKVTD